MRLSRWHSLEDRFKIRRKRDNRQRGTPLETAALLQNAPNSQTAVARRRSKDVNNCSNVESSALQSSADCPIERSTRRTNRCCLFVGSVERWARILPKNLRDA